MNRYNTKIYFEKSKNINIAGYEVFSINPITAMRKSIAVIGEDIKSEYIKMRTIGVVDTKYTEKYITAVNLKHTNIIRDEAHDIKVYVNNKQIPNNIILYNNNQNILFIYAIINNNDKIEIEYFIDAIGLEFNSEIEEQYVIVPLIKNRAGNHSILI